MRRMRTHPELLSLVWGYANGCCGKADLQKIENPPAKQLLAVG